MFALVIRHEGREQKKTFPKGSATIGRRAGNDVQLADTSVSKEHARIEERRKGCVIIDLDSANGTLVNGKPATKQRLRDGDVIRIGHTEMVFSEHASGNLETEIESAASAMSKGVGYETMLARITKDQKDKDMAAMKGMAQAGDTAFLEEMFQQMGWSEAESKRLAGEAKGRPVNEIEDDSVLSMERPKANEYLIRCADKIPDADSGHLVRYKGEEYLVLTAKKTDESWEYRLKRC